MAAGGNGALVAIVTALVFTAGLTNEAQSEQPDLQPDIVAFVQRRGGCQQLADLKKVAPADVVRIDEGMQSLKCNYISRDERSLRAQYANDPNVMKALDASWTRVVKRLHIRSPLPAPIHGDNRD